MPLCAHISTSTTASFTIPDFHVHLTPDVSTGRRASPGPHFSIHIRLHQDSSWFSLLRLSGEHYLPNPSVLLLIADVSVWVALLMLSLQKALPVLLQ